MEHQIFEPFHYPLTILEYHLDTFGHVNNATYLQMLEQARWEFITHRGFGLQTIRQTGLGPTILEWHIQFKRELTLRQRIIIQSQTISYEKKIGKLRQDIVDEQDVLYCHAEMTFGLFDTKERKLILPTKEWLYAIGLPA
jgi:thioesterase-3